MNELQSQTDKLRVQMAAMMTTAPLMGLQTPSQWQLPQYQAPPQMAFFRQQVPPTINVPQQQPFQQPISRKKRKAQSDGASQPNQWA